LNERLDVLRNRVINKEYRLWVQDPPLELSTEIANSELSGIRLSAQITCRMCEHEKAMIFPEERIVFTRTLPSILPVYSEEIQRRLSHGFVLHELGPISNICADWVMAYARG